MLKNEKVLLINKICGELECLLTNDCEFIFTEDAVYDAIEREKICQTIDEYRRQQVLELDDSL